MQDDPEHVMSSSGIAVESPAGREMILYNLNLIRS